MKKILLSVLLMFILNANSSYYSISGIDSVVSKVFKPIKIVKLYNESAGGPSKMSGKTSANGVSYNFHVKIKKQGIDNIAYVELWKM